MLFTANRVRGFWSLSQNVNPPEGGVQMRIGLFQGRINVDERLFGTSL